MPKKILVLGASYGSLLATKLLMAGHDVTLVGTPRTALVINDEGTEVRIRHKGEVGHRAYHSRDLPGRLDAKTAEVVDPRGYDLVVLAMSEPQLGAHAIWVLLLKIADARVPCLSLMNMPPLAYLKRIPGLDVAALEGACTNRRIWDKFDPELMTLCSPDPQAFRPDPARPNVLEVGLATNFKAAPFGDAAANDLLRGLDADIEAVRIEGAEVPVKLRVHDSVFVPLAKWSMLLAGNYRCVNHGGARAICQAVNEDLAVSRAIYGFVDGLVRKLGADPADLVPFEKYAKAADGLQKPSSVARALTAGSTSIERVDRLVQLIARQMGMRHPGIDAVVSVVDSTIEQNYYLSSLTHEERTALPGSDRDAA